MAQPHISLAAEKVGSIFGFPITNSILMTWLVMAGLTILAYLATRRISLVPSTAQSIAESVVEGLYNLFTSVVGRDYVNNFFPLLATIFLFVLVANWAGLLPGVGTIGIHETDVSSEVKTEEVVVSDASTPIEKAIGQNEKATTQSGSSARHEQSKFTPLLRGATADLNTTLAIALVAVVSIQYYGIKTLGVAYFKKFINLANPIMFGVGLLEVITEASRIISFAFRLFGNIFAGEVLLTVIAFLMPLLAPLPFLGLELFVGFIQALVFSMLTAVFLNMATIAHEGN